jgi:hypothetical protein
MSDLVNYTPIPLSALMSQINQFKYNPSAIQRVILDNLYQYTNGQADIVDPTNPFVFLLEASCVNTAVANQESLINLQRQYPALAQNFSDLYLHMSDTDYLNIFAEPAQTNFTWQINYNELLNNMVANPAINGKMATIARNTYTTVNGLSFSLNYPINIIEYANGYLEVVYDGSQVSPIQALQTNVIAHYVITDSSGVKWITFQTPMMQFSLFTTNLTIQSSTILNQQIPFTNRYYYARAFYQNSQNSPGWTEILTTYTQQVFNNSTPTVSLQVDNTNNVLNVYLPPVYVDSGLISGVLRIDIYTTMGQITQNLSNYQLSAFSTTLFAADPVNDQNVYTAVLPNVSYICYSANTVQGGSNGQTFEQLQQNVINNALGSVQIPITNVQLQSQAQLLGFNIVKNIDYITNRVFQATATLPAPSNPALITPAALTLNTLYVTLAQLQQNTQVVNNLLQSTILSQTVFIEQNGVLSIYPENQLQSLLQSGALNIANTVNSNQFFYTPFYYVLDYSSSEFELRAYDLDSPSASLINFIEQNQTLQLVVNTANIQIQKTSSGFIVTLVTASGPQYQALADSFVQVQLGFKPVGESARAYVLGTQIGKTQASERIFQFNLDINYYLNSSDQINFTNFNIYDNSVVNVLSELVQTFDIFYTTTSITTGYTPIISDTYIGKFQLPPNAAVITHEQVTLTFGYALNNLWRQSLVNQVGAVYQTYQTDVYATYPEIVYNTDPTTGSIFTINNTTNTVQFEILHNAGDPVLDANGQPVILHHAGDPVLDANGNPILNTNYTTQYACDLLLVDGKYYFATDPAYINYKKEILNVLDTWITQTLQNLSGQLLEQTKIYYYPAKAASTVTVRLSSTNTTTISAQQSFTVNIYLTSSAYENAKLRQQIQTNTISTINNYLKNTTVSINGIIDALTAIYDANVVSFNVSGLGGTNNYDTVTLVNPNESLSLAKILQVQENGLLIVTEDVTVNFINYQQ